MSNDAMPKRFSLDKFRHLISGFEWNFDICYLTFSGFINLDPCDPMDRVSGDGIEIVSDKAIRVLAHSF